jgi:hypothetical protein
VSHDLRNIHERQEKSITDDDVVHRDSEALDDNVSVFLYPNSIRFSSKFVKSSMVKVYSNTRLFGNAYSHVLGISHPE